MGYPTTKTEKLLIALIQVDNLSKLTSKFDNYNVLARHLIQIKVELEHKLSKTYDKENLQED